MTLENAKKFLTLMREDETLQDRTANRSEEEVMAVAKEMGLDFTSEELREASGVCELTLGEMQFIAGGKKRKRHKFTDDCPKNEEGHNWIKTSHYEDEGSAG